MELLINFIIWIFTVFGVTIIVTQTSITQPLRFKILSINRVLGTLLSCAICFSFWAAIGVSLLLSSMSGNLFLDGCLGSGLFWYVTAGLPQMPPPGPLPDIRSHK